MRRIITIAAVCLTLTGCNRARHGAEEAVRASLKDPDSAKFGEFYYNSTTKKACLTVNAKNSMGGYTGDEQVRLRNGDGGWESIGEVEEAPDDCRAYYADVGIPEPAKPMTDEDAIKQMDRDAAKLGAEADRASEGQSASGLASDLDNAAEAAHDAADNQSSEANP